MYYGDSGTPIHIEDRALAHLKVVIATKLRRDESFTLSWRHPDDQPRGRSTVWLHPSIPLRFVFDDPEAPELSRGWLKSSRNSANSSGGIMLIAEHFDTGPIETIETSDTGGALGDTVSLGNVEVAHLEIDRLSVNGTDLTAGTDAADMESVAGAALDAPPVEDD